MTTQEHTPGPWTVWTAFAGPHTYIHEGDMLTSMNANIFAGPDDLIVASLHWSSSRKSHGCVNHFEMLANAKLIAAAPEMIDTLRECRAYIEANNDGRWGDQMMERIDRIERAIVVQVPMEPVTEAAE